MRLPPGKMVMDMGVEMIQRAKDDPEEAITVALTQRDCAIVSFGNMLITYLFPELRPQCSDFATKIIDVGTAQEILPDLSDKEDDEMFKRFFGEGYQD